MTNLTYTTPSVGEKVTVAEPLVGTALTQIKKVVNGELGTGNLEASAGITEGQLATAVQEKLTTKVGLTVVKQKGSTTGSTENLYYMEEASTSLTLPTPTANRVIGVTCGIGIAAVKVKASTGKIYGDFITGATEVTLLENQHVLVEANGTNWFIVAGEPKREQVYKEETISRADAEAGVEPSETRDALVSVFSAESGQAVTVGGIIVGGTSTAGFQFRVPAGLKWKTQVVVHTSTLLL